MRRVRVRGHMRRVYKQTGKSNRRADSKRTAKRPGWRKSKSGKYFEARRNRSDRNRKRRL